MNRLIAGCLVTVLALAGCAAEEPASEVAGPAVQVNDVSTGNTLWTASGASGLLGLGSDWLITQSAEAEAGIQFFNVT